MQNQVAVSATSGGITTPATFDEFKAAYFLIKGKRDTDIRLFDDEKKFTIESINDLNNKIQSKLQIHQIVGSQMSINLGFSNRDVKSFGNWEEYLRTDWKVPYQTKYISLEWDFNVLLPNLGITIPQQHSVRIRIGREARPNEIIHIVFSGGRDEHEIDELNSQMCCKIDFVNSQLCNDLKNIVSEWYDSLPDASHDHFFEPIIVKNKIKIQQFIIFTWIVSGIIVSNYIAFNGIEKCQIQDLKDLFKSLFIYVTGFTGILYLCYSAGKLFSERVINKTISRLKKNPMIMFTSGDNNALETIKKRNKSLIRDLSYKLLISFLSMPITFFVGKLIKYIINTVG